MRKLSFSYKVVISKTKIIRAYYVLIYKDTYFCIYCFHVIYQKRGQQQTKSSLTFLFH